MTLDINKNTLIKYYERPGATYVVIPCGVKVICKQAFSDCHEITSVTIPNAMTEIGKTHLTTAESLLSIAKKAAAQNNTQLKTG